MTTTADRLELLRLIGELDRRLAGSLSGPDRLRAELLQRNLVEALHALRPEVAPSWVLRAHENAERFLARSAEHPAAA